MKNMSEGDHLEIRTLKDRLQEILGQIDEASQRPNLKTSKQVLNFCAAELHKEADKLVWIITRLK